MPNNEGKGNGKKGKGKKAVEILGKLRFPGDEHWQKLQLRLFANQVETLKKELADAEANPDSDYVDSARLREELVFVERKRTAIQEGNIILHVFQEEREDNIILRELQKENIMLGVNPASSLEAGAAHQAESARRSRSRRSRSPAWRRSSSPSSAQSEKTRDEAIAEKMIAEAAAAEKIAAAASAEKKIAEASAEKIADAASAEKIADSRMAEKTAEAASAGTLNELADAAKRPSLARGDKLSELAGQGKGASAELRQAASSVLVNELPADDSGSESDRYVVAPAGDRLVRSWRARASVEVVVDAIVVAVSSDAAAVSLGSAVVASFRATSSSQKVSAQHSPVEEDDFEMYLLKAFSRAQKPHAADIDAADVILRTAVHNNTTAVGEKRSFAMIAPEPGADDIAASRQQNTNIDAKRAKKDLAQPKREAKSEKTRDEPIAKQIAPAAAAKKIAAPASAEKIAEAASAEKIAAARLADLRVYLLAGQVALGRAAGIPLAPGWRAKSKAKLAALQPSFMKPRPRGVPCGEVTQLGEGWLASIRATGIYEDDLTAKRWLICLKRPEKGLEETCDGKVRAFYRYDVDLKDTHHIKKNLHKYARAVASAQRGLQSGGIGNRHCPLICYTSLLPPLLAATFFWWYKCNFGFFACFSQKKGVASKGGEVSQIRG